MSPCQRFHRSNRGEPEGYQGADKGGLLCRAVSKKNYVDMIQQLTREMKDDLLKSGVDQRKEAECDGKIEKLYLKVQYLADDSQKPAWLQAQATVRDV